MARQLRSSVADAGVDAYDRHVGRYGPALARAFVAAAGVGRAERALDVGCGTGALAAVMADRLGPANVAAIDPSERFAAACRARIPGADVRVGTAEELPWGDAEFDAVLAQLVVDGMDDARQGLREMRRVARAGAVLGACVWDFEQGMTLLLAVWAAAREVDEELAVSFGADKRLPYSRPDELEELWHATGLEDVEVGRIEASADYEDFDDLWYPFANGVGNLGRFHGALDVGTQERFKNAARERLGAPIGGFTLTAAAWFVRGRLEA
jgi:SAM-dependent methyltransferase